MHKSIRFSLPVLVLAAGAAAARADVTIASKVNSSTQTVAAAAHKIAVTADEGVMIFRGDKKLLWMVDAEKKSYMEMTEAEMAAMAARMKEAMAQLEAMKGQMPPAMLEQMKKAMPGASAPKRTVKPMGANKEINGFPCAGYMVASDDGTSSEVWSADPKAVRLEPGDLAAFKEFADFMKTALPGMEELDDWAKDFEHPKEGQVPGVPILTILKDKAGKEVLRTELVKIDHGAVAASVFEVPAGFAKEKMPEIGD
jgi:hypothetical protein